MITAKDLGCDDFERAAWNRHIVKNKLFTIAYQVVESALAHTPLKQPLASWIPRGSLPQVGKLESRRVSGGEGWVVEGDVVIIENEGGKENGYTGELDSDTVG